MGEAEPGQHISRVVVVMVGLCGYAWWRRKVMTPSPLIEIGIE